jgi:hypothetical protein
VGEVHQIILVEREYIPNDVLRHMWESVKRKLPDERCGLDWLLAYDSGSGYMAFSFH